MDIHSKEEEKEIENKMPNERRGFLKKAVYAAPTIVAMGALLKPKEANADFGPTPSDPDTNAWQ
jgi:hypothetical protein